MLLCLDAESFHGHPCFANDGVEIVHRPHSAQISSRSSQTFLLSFLIISMDLIQSRFCYGSLLRVMLTNAWSSVPGLVDECFACPFCCFIPLRPCWIGGASGSLHALVREIFAMNGWLSEPARRSQSRRVSWTQSAHDTRSMRFSMSH
jgi:hypothetical protein